MEFRFLLLKGLGISRTEALIKYSKHRKNQKCSRNHLVSNIDQFDFDLREFAESPQVARYDASDNGHFAWHSDVGEGILARKRKLTLVLQLSEPDSYEGGDLEIMPSAQILSANRGQGCVSVFPSFTLHQVAPVQSGVRYSLTLWAHGPVFR